jgi:hypothetical protein
MWVWSDRLLGHGIQLPGESPADSVYVSGAVITKNVVSRRMRTHITNPKIMVLRHAVAPAGFDCSGHLTP